MGWSKTASRVKDGGPDAMSVPRFVSVKTVDKECSDRRAAGLRGGNNHLLCYLGGLSTAPRTAAASSASANGLWMVFALLVSSPRCTIAFIGELVV
jgi:hypothetical protein